LVGTASWYGAGFHGRRTASGERFDRHALTAASRSLPLGSRVRVTNLTNGWMVIVRVNDRGPVARGRVLDVSYAAARELGMIERGSARVRIEPLEDS
jgi:rare lipoprotein A